jgi:hypothetical protein
LVTANLPSHTHAIDHNHASFNTGSTAATISAHTHAIDHDHGAFNTASAGTHQHDGKFLNVTNTGSGAAYGAFVNSASSFSGSGVLDAGLGADGSHLHSINVPALVDTSGSTTPTSPAHSHTADVPAYTGTSGPTGSGTAVDHTPANLRVNFAIKT